MLHFGFEGIKAESNEGGEGVIGSEYKNFTSVMKHEVLQYLGKRQGKPKVWVGEGQPYFVFSYQKMILYINVPLMSGKSILLSFVFTDVHLIRDFPIKSNFYQPPGWS